MSPAHLNTREGAVGATVLVAGIAHTGSSTPWPHVLLRDQRGKPVVVHVEDLYHDERYCVLRDSDQRGPAAPQEWMLKIVPKDALTRAEQLLGDVLEARTGFRSGEPSQA